MKHIASTLFIGLTLTFAACTKDKKDAPAAATTPPPAPSAPAPAATTPPPAAAAATPPAGEPAKTDDKPKEGAKAGGW
jgi:hypothetical protein